eukprot:COSAG01_NODE_10_length_42970_cov_93.010007_52_plen_82_part_00
MRMHSDPAAACLLAGEPPCMQPAAAPSAPPRRRATHAPRPAPPASHRRATYTQLLQRRGGVRFATPARLELLGPSVYPATS